MSHQTSRRRSLIVWTHLFAVLAMVLALAPAYTARAQDGDAQPAAELPLTVAEQLASLPGLVPAGLPEGVEVPEGMTAEELAQMPDRTKLAVIDYTVEGSAVNARVQLPASQATFIASGFPTSNFSSSSFLNLGWDRNGNNAMRMLLQFDLSALPANAQISSASFFINQSLITPANDSQSMSFRAQLMQQS